MKFSQGSDLDFTGFFALFELSVFVHHTSFFYFYYPENLKIMGFPFGSHFVGCFLIFSGVSLSSASDLITLSVYFL